MNLDDTTGSGSQVSAFSSSTRHSKSKLVPVKCKFCNRGNHPIEKMLGQAPRTSISQKEDFR
jgi:hypothetical protein